MIIQSDRSILLEVDNPRFIEARNTIAKFAELEKSPEHIHTYRITPLSIWNATASGLQAEEILAALERFSKFPVPDNLRHEITELAGRYGKITLDSAEDGLTLFIDDPLLARQIAHHPKVIPFLHITPDNCVFRVDTRYRGEIKRVLTQLGFPVKDIAGYIQGQPFSISLRQQMHENRPFASGS